MKASQKELIRDTTLDELEYFDAIFEPENYSIRFEKSGFQAVNNEYA